jgi:hypothetical protein
MDILIGFGFWVLILAYLLFIHVMILGIASMLVALPFHLLGLGDKAAGVISSNMGASIALYGFVYNKLWILNFNEPAPIVFYTLGLVASWMGSGSDTVEANLGNKLMTSGEVAGILICIVIAFFNDASFF